MQVSFKIEGTLTLPEGTVFAPSQMNLLLLPDGRTISVHPVIELNTSVDDDNHRNIGQIESEQFGVYFGDYDRELYDLNDEEEPVIVIVQQPEFQSDDRYNFEQEKGKADVTS